MAEENSFPSGGFNTLNEKPLHAAIKQWYAGPDDRVEVKLDGYFIDVIHDDLLIEIQTGSFSAIKRKLYDLCERYPVRLVYPIAVEKWIVYLPKEGEKKERRRKSPGRRGVEYLFRELIYLPHLLKHENFSVEVLLIQEEEVRRSEGQRTRWHKGWVKEERRLISVLGRKEFKTPADLANLIPASLPEVFTIKELSKELRQPDWLARRMIYCLKAVGVLEPAGKRSRSNLYKRL